MTRAGLLAAVLAAVDAGETSPSGVLARIADAHFRSTRRTVVHYETTEGNAQRLDLGHVRAAIDTLAARGQIVRAWGRRTGNWTGARLAPAQVTP